MHLEVASDGQEGHERDHHQCQLPGGFKCHNDGDCHTQYQLHCGTKTETSGLEGVERGGEGKEKGGERGRERGGEGVGGNKMIGEEGMEEVAMPTKGRVHRV